MSTRKKQWTNERGDIFRECRPRDCYLCQKGEEKEHFHRKRIPREVIDLSDHMLQQTIFAAARLRTAQEVEEALLRAQRNDSVSKARGQLHPQRAEVTYGLDIARRMVAVLADEYAQLAEEWLDAQ